MICSKSRSSVTSLPSSKWKSTTARPTHYRVLHCIAHITQTDMRHPQYDSCKIFWVTNHRNEGRYYILPSAQQEFSKGIITGFNQFLVILTTFFPLWVYSPIQALAASMKLTVSLQLLDLGQSVGLVGRVIGSSQSLYLHTNTEKRTHNTNTKHPCPHWDTNPRFRRPRERRQFML
jgi:hypothetical protein